MHASWYSVLQRLERLVDNGGFFLLKMRDMAELAAGIASALYMLNLGFHGFLKVLVVAS